MKTTIKVRKKEKQCQKSQKPGKVQSYSIEVVANFRVFSKPTTFVCNSIIARNIRVARLKGIIIHATLRRRAIGAAEASAVAVVAVAERQGARERFDALAIAQRHTIRISCEENTLERKRKIRQWKKK